jgi:hypothetical protein
MPRVGRRVLQEWRSATRWGVALLALWWIGCATAPEPGIVLKRVLLAPLSFNQNLPEQLDAAPFVVQEEMAAYFSSRGVAVVAPTLAEFYDSWQIAGKETGTLYDDQGVFVPERFDNVVRDLIEDYRARSESFDLLVLSYIDVKPVTIRAGSATWDGVERKVRVDREGVSGGLRWWPNRTNANCVSLRIVAYRPDGSRLFERRGGLEVANEFRSRNLQVSIRQDLFQDRVAVREGVEIALAPLFRE